MHWVVCATELTIYQPIFCCYLFCILPAPNSTLRLVDWLEMHSATAHNSPSCSSQRCLGCVATYHPTHQHWLTSRFMYRRGACVFAPYDVALRCCTVRFSWLFIIFYLPWFVVVAFWKLYPGARGASLRF